MLKLGSVVACQESELGDLAICDSQIRSEFCKLSVMLSSTPKRPLIRNLGLQAGSVGEQDYSPVGAVPDWQVHDPPGHQHAVSPASVRHKRSARAARVASPAQLA
jgi:hypothetical protein